MSVRVKLLTRVWLCNPVDCGLPGSSARGGFSRQEYWSGLTFPSPGDLPDPGIEPRSPALQPDALPPELPGKPQRSLQKLHHRSLPKLTRSLHPPETPQEVLEGLVTIRHCSRVPDCFVCVCVCVWLFFFLSHWPFWQTGGAHRSSHPQSNVFKWK